MTKNNFKKYYKGKCQALTKTGKPCNRDAVGSKYCWQHQMEENQHEKNWPAGSQ